MLGYCGRKGTLWGVGPSLYLYLSHHGVSPQPLLLLQGILAPFLSKIGFRPSAMVVVALRSLT